MSGRGADVHVITDQQDIGVDPEDEIEFFCQGLADGWDLDPSTGSAAVDVRHDAQLASVAVRVSLHPRNRQFGNRAKNLVVGCQHQN